MVAMNRWKMVSERCAKNNNVNATIITEKRSSMVVEMITRKN